MDVANITFPFFLSQALNALLTLAGLLLIALALRSLRRRHLSDEAKALWTAVIILIPFLGPLAFWTVIPPIVVHSRALVKYQPWSTSPHRESYVIPADERGVEHDKTLREPLVF